MSDHLLRRVFSDPQANQQASAEAKMLNARAISESAQIIRKLDERIGGLRSLGEQASRQR